MKKIYTTFLLAFAFVALVNAQSTLFSTDFSTADYTTGGPQTDLDSHPDWNAGHFGNANTWVAFTSAEPREVIRTGAFFTYALVDSTPITATDGDVITITVNIDLGFNGQTYGTEPDENLIFIGLLDKNNPMSGAEANNANRDGIMIQNKGTTNELALTNNNGGAGSGFGTTGVLASELNARRYEVVVEYLIGADAASSSKSAQITSINGTAGSAVTSYSTALSGDIYTELTGTGAYFFTWALRFGFGSSAISHLHINSMSVTKNMPVLSTNKNNAFEFGLYPNPVNDELHINTQEAINKVEVLDLLGRQVLFQENVLDTVDVSSLKSALYIVRLSSDRGVSTRKFLKK
ncbi:T9SS type A sorting domain-containing protein [Hyunsoonleella sp. SJ7]|uniref:T9SS type A sorting domain-containing protein n=1 Tax=Hyunsoonleella aquatilis TaxID=2762758 RepID=A0A923KL68_9FLAO|nr:T9SS type A sorting domain-containing protein [Hyunsoonleella aquatilis]MBC3759202.1 T9SS type A sorting domain-containing protein [Hyunsoonleella aquatilis]